ncbi:MAG: heat-inducible transcriptional repressor HrcA [Chloracidobacterium sp.]|uniref:Heat-inducible transcription repressor HrcA n=1 Tax=Chloracidobacterium validum TaxID=2821543 RepID=A0ABX8B9Q1_9BACT|nr:heat-inducible transcriptional repressor HrcA [Chloracidobacterium validum]QUW03668.1 heat-inducible transcription repressor HrcA [Chloracidobacterium validum]
MGKRRATHGLDERSHELLLALVRLHIATGEPIGSRTLSKQAGQTLSPASIRNIMADLEEQGYVVQPHTSAGRVPTDRGYRYYVDNLVADFDARPSQTDEEIIQRSLFSDPNVTSEDVLARASHVLSNLSSHVGVVLSPPLSRDILQHIDFVRLEARRILVITVSRTGLVRNFVVRVDEDIPLGELERTANYIVENFAGRSLADIRVELLKRMSEEKSLYDRLLKNALVLCNQDLGTSASETDVYVDGTVNILDAPEFANTARMRTIFRMFEEKGRLVKILNACLSQADTTSGIVVQIGTEHHVPGLRDCAIVTAPYYYRPDSVGSVTVVGPMRMRYGRVMRLVGYMAKMFNQLLSDTTQSPFPPALVGQPTGQIQVVNLPSGGPPRSVR